MDLPIFSRSGDRKPFLEPGHDPERRRLLRQALGLMGCAAVTPSLAAALEHVHQVAKEKGRFLPIAEGTELQFFNKPEFESLCTLVELILPRTDTPGAKDAGVPWYLDIVVNADPELRTKFRQGLEWLEIHSRQEFGTSFTGGTVDQQVKLLESTLPANSEGHAFFETVKAMTLVGYYSSEIGLREELHYVGDEYLPEFKGCPHGGHSLDLPPGNEG
jgi:gluconate 2-dehydrogenase gamma chain